MPSLAEPAMRAAFPGFTWTPIGHDPVFGKYRVLRTERPGVEALMALNNARTNGYGVTRHPDGRITLSVSR